MTAELIEGARLILDDRIETASVRIEDGLITGIDVARDGAAVVPGAGRLLAPAFVDIHGDAFERQLMPRPGVTVDTGAALLETDRQLAANGIATAYHALTLSWEPGLRSVATGWQVVRALDLLRPRLTADNRIQLRWETFCPEAEPLIRHVLAGPDRPSLAFNDHTSAALLHPDVALHDRPFDQVADYPVTDLAADGFLRKMSERAKRAHMSTDDFVALITRIWAQRAEVPGHIDRIVLGAPNAMRGGSHLGSPGAADMIARGLCDILASDYYYPAMLGAMVRLHADRVAPLPTLWALVSGNPATAMGLTDRGRIAAGLRADLVLLDWPEGHAPAPVRTWVSGRGGYSCLPVSRLPDSPG